MSTLRKFRSTVICTTNWISEALIILITASFTYSTWVFSRTTRGFITWPSSGITIRIAYRKYIISNDILALKQLYVSRSPYTWFWSLLYLQNICRGKSLMMNILCSPMDTARSNLHNYIEHRILQHNWNLFYRLLLLSPD